jgi:hypothetical protein
MRGSKTKVDISIRNALAGINRTSEGEHVRAYLEAKLDVLANKALTCDPADIEEIQGRARSLEEMLRDLRGERIVDDTNQ